VQKQLTAENTGVPKDKNAKVSIKSTVNQVLTANTKIHSKVFQ